MSGHTPWRCRRKGHDWFPPIQQREFMPWESRCLRGRCTAVHIELPGGLCLGPPQHPIAEHYDSRTGLVKRHPTCAGPK